MFQNRNITLRIVVAVILSVGLAACSEKSRSPLSPYVAGPMEGVSIGAPSPLGPLDGTLVAVGDPLILRFGSATSNSERPFWYEIQLVADSQFLDVRHEADQVDPVDEGRGGLAEGGTHDYTVPDPLDADRPTGGGPEPSTEPTSAPIRMRRRSRSSRLSCSAFQSPRRLPMERHWPI